jgi:predicted kinase
MLRDLRSDISPGLKKRIADALTQAEKEWRDIQDLAREQLKRRMQEGRLHYLELERELY